MPRVGEYDLGETIGRGAFSKVKLCVHTPTGEQFVAKILPISKEVETEVRREIAILRKIVHPHVVRLKEILQSARNFYIILEPVRGGDLCSLIMKDQHENGLPEPVVADFFNQILGGVMACHAAGVAHRDLKPENLLLTEENKVKITDFGLSRMHPNLLDGPSGTSLSPSEYATTLTGTLAYVAPEVLSRHYDPFKADIWSLGCILYVMLTGKFPFGSASGRQLEELIRRAAWIQLPPTVSPEAQELCRGLLVLDPAARMSLESVRESAFLKKYVGNSTVPASSLQSLQSGDYTSLNFESVDEDLTMSIAGPSSPMVKRPPRKLPV